MTLTLFDPRTGTLVKLTVPDTPRSATGAAAAAEPRTAPAGLAKGSSTRSLPSRVTMGDVGLDRDGQA